MSEGFGVRGVVEGFYGPPWSLAERRAVVSALAAAGMNAYLHAPKDDPHHRDRWREPHPPHEREELGALAGTCADLGVRFGYGLSPGLDVDASDRDDREALVAKLRPLAEQGVDWFVLAYDDLPAGPDVDVRRRGGDHAALVREVRSRLPGVDVTVVPTDYVGTRPSPYLDELSAGLDPDVSVMWTGHTVVPARITEAEARARAEATGGRPPLLWDNYPVNDSLMSSSLHLAPLRGREPGLARACSGILANPMPLPRASLLALLTVAEFARDPSAYDPEAAWSRAIEEVGGAAAGAVGVLARACSSARVGASEAVLHRLVDAVEAGDPGATERIRVELDAVGTLEADLPEVLAAEVEPWVAQARREAAAGLAALALLGEGRGRGPAGDGGSAAGGDPGLLRALTLLALWREARHHADRVVYGPRFACYAAAVQGPDGRLTLDPGEALVEDRSAIDRLCRLALSAAGTAG